MPVCTRHLQKFKQTLQIHEFSFHIFLNKNHHIALLISFHFEPFTLVVAGLLLRGEFGREDFGACSSTPLASSLSFSSFSPESVGPNSASYSLYATSKLYLLL